MSLKYRVVPHQSIYQFKWALEKKVGFCYQRVNWYINKEDALADLERLNTDPIYYVPKGKMINEYPSNKRSSTY